MPRNPANPNAPASRSAVTNGNALFVSGNPNTPWARRYRDLIVEIAVDLGGVDLLSQAQQALIRRGAALSVELEMMEGRLSEGLSVDLDLYGRLASHQRRILESLGLKRQPKNVTPSIHEYRAMRAREAAS